MEEVEGRYKDSRLIIYQNFLYLREGRTRNHAYSLLRCRKYRYHCPARAIVHDTVISVEGCHNHIEENEEIGILKLRDKILQRVVSSNHSLRDVFDDITRDDAFANLISFASMERAMRIRRASFQASTVYRLPQSVTNDQQISAGTFQCNATAPVDTQPLTTHNQHGAGTVTDAITVTTRRHFRGSYIIVEMVLHIPILNVLEFLNNHWNFVEDHINATMQQQHHYKVQMYTLVEFTRFDVDTHEVHDKSWHVSTHSTILENQAVLHEFLNGKAAELDVKIAGYTSCSSGWIIKRIIKAGFAMNRYIPLTHLAGH